MIDVRRVVDDVGVAAATAEQRVDPGAARQGVGAAVAGEGVVQRCCR
jgi:hypothetical protein